MFSEHVSLSNLSDLILHFVYSWCYLTFFIRSVIIKYSCKKLPADLLMHVVNFQFA